MITLTSFNLVLDYCSKNNLVVVGVLLTTTLKKKILIYFSSNLYPTPLTVLT